MVRILLLLVVTLTAMFFPLWVFIVAGFVYALFYTPYEVMIIGLCIDSQFGEQARGLWYLYTLATVCIFFVTLYVRPFLRFYRE